MFKSILLMPALLVLAVGTSPAENSCPFGLTDDPAPGQCGSYRDSNADGICDQSQDLSQSGGASTEGPENVAPSEDQPPSEVPTENAPEPADQPQPPEPAMVPEESPLNQPETTTKDRTPAGPARTGGPNYHPWFLLLLIAILAVAGELWQKKDPQKLPLVQTIWNWLLMMGFLACSLTGIYFILPPGSRPQVAFNLSYWHTLTGLLFIYIGLYHALRRASCLIRGPRSCVRQTPCC